MGRSQVRSIRLGFLGSWLFRCKAPAYEGLDFLGFPWILWSESRLFNGLRGFFAGRIFAGLFPTLRGAATGACGRAMRKRRIIHGASLTWLPIFRKRLSSASFPLRPPQSTGNSLSAAQRNGGSRSRSARLIRSRSSIIPPPAPGRSTLSPGCGGGDPRRFRSNARSRGLRSSRSPARRGW